MPRTSEKRYMPCHVAGCKFLTTSNAGLKNHLRIHAPELRAKRRREQARREPETHGNTTNNILDDNWNNINSNQDDNESEVENDDDEEGDERRNPSMPQRDTNRSIPEDIQYHPIINGMCILCMSLHKCPLFSRPPL